MTQYQFYLQNSSATCSTTFNVGATTTMTVSDASTTDAYAANAYVGGIITFSSISGYSGVVQLNSLGPGGTFTFAPALTPPPTPNTGTFTVSEVSQCPITNSLFYIHGINQNQSFVSIYNGTNYDFMNSQQYLNFNRFNVGTTVSTTTVSDASTTDSYAASVYTGWTITFSPSSGASPLTSTVTGNTLGPGGTFTFSPMVTGLTANTGTFTLSTTDFQYPGLTVPIEDFHSCSVPSGSFTVGTATTTTVSVSSASDTYAANAYAGCIITFSPSSGAAPLTNVYTVTSNTAAGLSNSGVFTFVPALTTPPTTTSTFTLVPGWTLGYYNELGTTNPLWICNTNGIQLTGASDTPTQESQQPFLTFTNPSATTPIVPGCNAVVPPPNPPATPPTLVSSVRAGQPPAGVQTAVWDNANITIRNFNTQISNLRDVEFGGFWITHWTAPPQTSTYNATGITMLLPPEGPTQVDFSVANFNVTKSTSFQITLEAADANDFSAYYPIAAPFVSSNIVAQNLGEVTEDVLDLSATPSTNQTISGYIWQVNFPETGWTQGDWADTAHLITAFASGQSLDLSPNLLTGNPLLPGASANGPFQVTVMSVNPYGQIASSTSLIVPENPDMAPASEINAVETLGPCSPGPATVTVTVTNILGQPVSGVTVYFVPLGHASGDLASPTFATTGSGGQAVTMITCSAPFTLEITSPGINPLVLSVM